MLERKTSYERGELPPGMDRGTMLDLLRAEGAIFNPKSRVRPDPRPVVYYILWSDRIKIGFTTQLAERLRALYHDEVLAVEPGSRSLERRRHMQFADARVEGQREWFHDTPALRFHINTVRSEHPNLMRSFIK